MEDTLSEKPWQEKRNHWKRTQNLGSPITLTPKSSPFGPEAEFEVSLGYCVAAFEIAGYRPRDELVYDSYGLPGRHILRFSMREDKTLFLFVW